MGASTRCAPKGARTDVSTHSATGTPSEALRQALSKLPAGQPVAVALSGGSDSVALALMAAQVCESDRPLHLFHIHHGLLAQADEWVQHLTQFAQALGVPLSVRYVQVDLGQGLGTEASAREARYAALAELAHEHQVVAILLAHHQQDQAETVLLRLLRGAGVLGLSAMQEDVERQGMRLLRPWLDVERADLVAIAHAYAARTGWHAVLDPSNADPQYKRGAFRTELVPALEKHWPAWRQTLVRHAKQAGEVNEILEEVAATDWLTLEPSALGLSPVVAEHPQRGQSFSLAAWRVLSPARQALVLRYWLRQLEVPMPTERRLAELMRQLRQLHALGHDRELLWQHSAVSVRCVRGRVSLTSG